MIDKLIKIIRSSIRFICACLVSMLILTLFTLIYSFSGLHVKNDTGATDYKWSPYQYKATMTEGFAWIKMDQSGFNNPKQVSRNTLDILVMGSSQMEAINVSQNDNAVALLRKMLPDEIIYNIGISAHSIYVCAKNLAAAVKEYRPSDYVIVVADMVSLSDADMQKVIDGKFKTIPSYDSGILYYIQKYCPAIKNLYNSIQDWKEAEHKSAKSQEKNEEEALLLNDFLRKMKADSGDTQLIILYQPRTKIDERGQFVDSGEDVAPFEEACKINDIIFVDMTDDFDQLYYRDHILTHGFFNTAVGVGHLNKYGHRAIAERLADVIMEDQKK